MREVTFDDVVTVVDQFIDEGKPFTSKDVTDAIRSQSIHAMNKDVSTMLRDNWGYLSHGSTYQRTSVEVEQGITAILYHPAEASDTKGESQDVVDALQDVVDEFVAGSNSYTLQSVLEGLDLEDAPYEERSRISDWLRRHVPDGYAKMRTGTVNEYVPSVAVTSPNVTATVKTISREEAEKIITDTIEQFDAILSNVVNGFNKQIADMHDAFEALFK